LKERRAYTALLLSSQFVTYLLCRGPDHLQPQGFGSIQGHQWKDCCGEGTASPHSNAALNETIYFSVFKGLKMQLLDAPL